MKVVHVLKRMETIDNDVKDLRKLEKSIRRDKSFATPIFMSIEKQINILLGERIKLLELRIENPPAHMVEEIEGTEEERKAAAPKKKTAKKKGAAKKTAKKATNKKIDDSFMDDEIPMLTQDKIDSQFDTLQAKHSTEKKEQKPTPEDTDDQDVKLLDLALEKGTVNKKEVEKEKKVRFFRDNFPTD